MKLEFVNGYWTLHVDGQPKPLMQFESLATANELVPEAEIVT